MYSNLQNSFHRIGENVSGVQVVELSVLCSFIHNKFPEVYANFGQVELYAKLNDYSKYRIHAK